MSETPAVAVPVPVPAPPPPEPVAVAPVPLTAAPEEATEAPRTKRKYTKRAVSAAPKKKAKRTMKAKSVKKAKSAKTARKAKRVAGVKAQGQVAKEVFKFIKALAKEQGVPVAKIVTEAVTSHATRRGLKLEA